MEERLALYRQELEEQSKAEVARQVGRGSEYHGSRLRVCKGVGRE
jgi:hypothetical protein